MELVREFFYGSAFLESMEDIEKQLAVLSLYDEAVTDETQTIAPIYHKTKVGVSLK